MTEESKPQNQELKKQKKRQKILIKFAVIISTIIFGYFSFKYWQTQRLLAFKAKGEVQKFDNIDGEIFDLSSEYKSNQNDDSSGDLTNMNPNELHERGVDFIYQNLLKNQVQIDDLRNQIRDLKADINKYKTREIVGRITYSYIDFRQKFFSGKDFDKEFKNFETLASFDVTLQAKADKLKNSLPEFRDQKELQKIFKSLIPDIITIKKNIPNSGIIAKIRYNISKLVVIRKISVKDGNDVDAVIVRIEESLANENYQEALNNTLLLDQKYHELLKDFLTTLSISLEVQKTDQEILNYLKILS